MVHHWQQSCLAARLSGAELHAGATFGRRVARGRDFRAQSQLCDAESHWRAHKGLPTRRAGGCWSRPTSDRRCAVGLCCRSLTVRSNLWRLGPPLAAELHAGATFGSRVNSATQSRRGAHVGRPTRRRAADPAEGGRPGGRAADPAEGRPTPRKGGRPTRRLICTGGPPAPTEDPPRRAQYSVRASFASQASKGVDDCGIRTDTTGMSQVPRSRANSS